MTRPSAPTLPEALDVRELHARYSRSQIREFKLRAEGTSLRSHRGRDAFRSVAVILVVGVAMVFVTLSAMVIATTLLTRSNSVLSLVLALVVGAFIGLASVKLIGIWRRDVRFGVGWRHLMHLDRFALVNNMAYIPEIWAPHYDGSMFGIGGARRAFDVVATSTGRYIEIGNYQYCGDTAFNRSLNECGYVRVELDRPLPHLYLRSRRSRKLGATFARAQEFELEGDFGKYFRLYAPRGYERDALYIFTPDVMAVLIDEAAAFDIEFVGAHIYFYSSRRFNMRDPAVYRRCIGVVDSVVGRALKQTRAYSDPRSSGDYVSGSGARLRPGVTIAAIAGVVLLIAQIWHLTHLFG